MDSMSKGIENGQITLEDAGVVLSPTTQPEELLAALPTARLAVANGKWKTYELGQHVIVGATFLVRVVFEADQLRMVSLFHPMEGEKSHGERVLEAERQAFHDQWLRRPRNAPARATYPFGHVDSMINPKDLCASITLHYA
jgi:hypothetical protein